MPYQWTQTEPAQRLRLWPHRSMEPRGFVTFIAVTAGFFLVPLSVVLGTVVLWWILPFMCLTLWLTWALIQRNVKDGELTETLTIDGEHMQLVRDNPRGPSQTWQANPYWVRVECDAKGGPVQNYITLHGDGREVEIGAFLSPEERAALFRELQDRLRALDINTH